MPLRWSMLENIKRRLAERYESVSNSPRPGRLLLKWSGGKKRQAAVIVGRFPTAIDTYFEPFVGGGAVLYQLLCSPIEVRRFECSDICAPLIDLWNIVKYEPRRLLNAYEQMWHCLRREGKDYYYYVRQLFDASGDPCQFFFLVRTCRNGLIRFNQERKFNTGFHPRRRFMAPDRLKPILEDWHSKLSSHNVLFSVRDYRSVLSQDGDFLYLDPPYRTSLRFYYGRIAFEQFFPWLSKQRGGYVLSLNGFSGKEDQRVEVPRSLYDEHFLIPTGSRRCQHNKGLISQEQSDSIYSKRNSFHRASIPIILDE